MNCNPLCNTEIQILLIEFNNTVMLYKAVNSSTMIIANHYTVCVQHWKIAETPNDVHAAKCSV